MLIDILREAEAAKPAGPVAVAAFPARRVA
jgi:hypothetical protein